MPAPAALAAAFDILNAGRARVGARPLLWDDRLAAMAQDLADWGWATVQSGGDYQADPHHEFLERAARHGWPSTMPGPPDARRGIGNYSECGAPGTGGARGWEYPVRTAEEHAQHLVWMLTESDLAADRSEAHVWDFRAGWTHGGIGMKEGMFVLEYGYLPGSGPEPSPTPTPPTPPGLTLADALAL